MFPYYLPLPFPKGDSLATYAASKPKAQCMQLSIVENCAYKL